jgi:cytochrome P450
LEKFVDLGVSFFDEDFTLDPFPYIEDLYDRDDILGFRADGMNFVFRFEQACQIIHGRSCRREPLASPEIEARERVYAERYPHRARHFQLAYPGMGGDGKPDFVTKKLLMDFLDETALIADFSRAHVIFERLAGGGRVDDYIEAVQTLPLRVMLETCGLPFSEAELADLALAGMQFIKALDNFVDEAVLPAADDAVVRTWRYLDARLDEAAPEAPIRRLVARGRSLGIEHDTLRTNIGGFIIQALSNTAGISSAYVLRSLIRNPQVRTELAKNRQLLRSDDVITELLRRDNHVKALARQVHEDFELGIFPMRRGESVHVFFPGVNLDPAQYADPLSIDLNRKLRGGSHLVFGGSAHICIGKKLGLEFVRSMAAGFVEHLPDHARVLEDEVRADGDWVAERIITRMPIALDA